MTSKLKNITFAFLMLLTISSCKKGWLDVNSGIEIDSDAQFSSESGYKDALMGVYIGMTDPALYAKDMTWSLIDILSHQYRPLTANTPYLDINGHNYKTIKAAAQIDAIWNKSYNTIANINNALRNIDKNRSILDPINYALIKGELLGLRAFLHFDLMRVYGYGNLANRPELAGKLAVPYVSAFGKDITPQVSYKQTFELLKKDIDEALALLVEDPIFNNPKKPSSYYANVNRDGFYNKREQRLNYYAVKALQARVLLWEGGAENKAKAALAAEEVIEFSPARLVSSPSAVVDDPSLYSEHLFNLNITGFLDIINTYLNANSASTPYALYLTNARAQTVFETSNANIGLSDFRYNSLLSAQNLGMVSIKFYQTLAVTPARNTMPLMKLPEMYYIAAEHYLSTNPAKSVEYLNLVRENRGIIEPISSNSDLAAELDKEYQKEFIMEGQLFFYYKRLGKVTYTDLPSTIVADDKVYVLPYPAAEIEFGNRVQ